MERYTWTNKWIFILAAIWSAAWLWNLRRFPFVVYDNWWAVFLIVYTILLLTLWISFLVWELALWQKYSSWLPSSVEKIKPFLKIFWWMAVLWAAAIMTYYSVVIWWGIVYLFYSFIWLNWQLPWTWDTSTFFFKNVLNLTESVSDFWTISIPVLIWTIITWILIYLFTFKSTKSVGKVVVITATLPFLTLLVLAIRWITLPWSNLWFDYLFKITDRSKLYDINIRKAAVWQLFFSLSVAMWVMVAYWALRKQNDEIVKSSIIIALWDYIISLLSSIVIFSTLWYLAYTKWVDITQVLKWWPSLAFIVFPQILSFLPTLQWLFSIIFFITVFALAIDSAMSLVEALSVSIRDKFNVKVEKITLIIVILLWLLSLMYTFWNWLYLLDIIDYYLTSWLLIFIWLFMLFIFLYNKDLLSFIQERNELKIINKYYFIISWIIGFILILLILIDNITKWIYYGDYWKYSLIWILVIFNIFIISLFLSKK